MPQGKQKDYERTRLHYEISAIYEEEEKKKSNDNFFFFKGYALVYFEASRIVSLWHFRELSLPLGKNTFRYRNGRLCLALQAFFREPVGREINFRWLFRLVSVSKGVSTAV
ncbi:hypothetical protein CDAR_171781 [Caerostris darwini]|uniref:Uncharacterized protein n=1 Tax=Caerostris darwini TaxID=1538125 RepID=A0AAV4QK66_9ARAC|nr:hypothetical protein CDAR_171781 [Caerostris darwini]